MKRALSVFLAIALITGLSMTAFAAGEIALYLNGVEIPQLEENHQFAHVENGTIYLPLRNIFEAMGAMVEWDGENKVITCRGTVNFLVYIGEGRMLLNDDEVSLDISTKLFNDRTFIEKSVIEKAMKATVTFDDSANRVDITYDENYGMEIDFSGLEASYDDEE